MYDTIKLRLNTNSTRFFKTCSFEDRLSNVSEVYKRDGSAYLKANLGNLRVLWDEQGVLLSGSVSKWFLGDNFQILDSNRLVLAIEQLSDLFSLSFKSAKVMRLDLAGNLIMNFQPLIYYPYLGNCRYYVRLEQPKTIYYSNNFRTKLFYDKIAESKSKVEFIPKDYCRKYILRYELRYTRSLGKQFNCAGLYLENLCNTDFYLSLIERWEKEYKLIRKVRELESADYTKIKAKRQLYPQAILHLIQAQGGIQNVLQSINESMIKGELTRKQAFDLKQVYIQASESSQLTKKSDLIVELDKKIHLFCQKLKENL